MSWTNWACLILIITGVIILLYGANIYNANFGWIGFYLALSGIIIYIILLAYNEINKRRHSQPQNP